MTFQPDPATRAVRASLESDTQHGAVVPPLHPTSNYTFKGYARKRQHEETAQSLADTLTRHAGVRRVYYPGLESHKGHAIASRQQSGFGGMLSFEIVGGEAAVRAFVEHLQFFSLAESLGGVESLVCHPPTMTHAPVSEAALTAAGISQNLIRLSVGLESVDDLTRDVLAALDVASRTAVVTSVATAS